MANELLVKPETYSISKDYFDSNIPRMNGETIKEFDLFKAFLWTNLTPHKFARVITQTPEKIQAYLDSRKYKNALLKFADEKSYNGIIELSKQWNWLERRSNYRFQIAQQVNEDIAFKFLNDSLDNFSKAQEASKQGLNLMNELLTLGLIDPENFNGKKFSDLASGMKVIFEEARLFSGNPTENINIKDKENFETNETKQKLDELLSNIEEIKDNKDEPKDIIDVEVVEKDES